MELLESELKILETSSFSIGKIKNIRIEDIGFNFQVDKTVRPSVYLPQVVKVDSLASFDSVAITSTGKGYVRAPKILAFDGKTNERITDVDFQYNLGDSQLTILKNTFGMNNTSPKLIPVQNSNGVGISTIAYDSNTMDATVTLGCWILHHQLFPILS